MKSGKLAQKIGKLLMVGFDGTTPTKEVERQIQKNHVGGVILFLRNIQSPLQLAQLTADLQALSKEGPLLIGVDQEGGRVSRLPHPFTQFPPARVFGQLNDIPLTYNAAEAMARELTAVGINLNFAPVLDVDTNPDNPVIGNRAFGKSPLVVAEHGLAMMSGLQDNKVIACGKHFPGHGDTNLDSHKTLPSVNHPLAHLTDIELKPFIHLVQNRLASVMTAHVLYKALDPKRPATLSKKIVTTLLREAIGFSGVVISDDLEMQGITDYGTVADAAVLAIVAGCDLLLVCQSFDQQIAALEALIHAVEKGDIAEERIERSAHRILALKDRFHVGGRKIDLNQTKKVVGSEQHRSLVDEIERRAAAGAR
ncbi:MAG: beta-N-acetylhexosaminidase [Nitrospirae bacterium]|nr:beta-N-acetylhexosaminidase [Candidatus Troglogloeales bacterium]